MGKSYRHLLIACILVFCGLLGWWVGRDWKPASVISQVGTPLTGSPTPKATISPRSENHDNREGFRDGTTVEIFASRQNGEAILRFPTNTSYGEFIESFDNPSIQIVDRLDRLRALRLSFANWEDLSAMLVGEKIVAYDSLPEMPPPSATSDATQRGAIGFDDGVLDWLGVDPDHAQWGAGVTIAVLDSGIVAHSGLPGFTTSIAITPFPADLSETRGHGTAVASLIAGNDPLAPGVAPAAKIISVRVTDETGRSDCFDFAAGILAAVDAGAQIINCSMGTTVDNPLIEEAVLFARDNGVLIVAAAGNSEQAEASYPAAYPSVISVGAVDARGEHLDFSNYGTYLSLTAPGFQVNTAWPGNTYTKMSGTSVSAPLVTGAIAATMSSGRGVTMTANAAAEIVMSQSNEAGIPGPDSEYGVGILNVGRIMSRNTPHLVDAAITNQRLVKSTRPGGEDDLQVTIHNRGTAVLVNTVVDVETPVGKRQFSAAMLAPGAIQTFSMPVQLTNWAKGQAFRVHSSLTLGMIGEDLTPQNNQRTDRLLRR